MYVRQTEPNNYLSVLKDVKAKEIFNIIIDIQPENMANLLNAVSGCALAAILCSFDAFPRLTSDFWR